MTVRGSPDPRGRRRVAPRRCRAYNPFPITRWESKRSITMAEGVLELTDQNFDAEVVRSSQPVLVDFWAEWCMPCRMLAPTINDLAREFAGKVKVGKIDTDANREAAVQYGIQSLPTILIFKNGQVINKFVGVLPKKDFVAALQKATE